MYVGAVEGGGRKESVLWNINIFSPHNRLYSEMFFFSPGDKISDGVRSRKLGVFSGMDIVVRQKRIARGFFLGGEGGRRRGELGS